MTNQAQAALLVEELIRSGVDFFCLSPGSRSTPLTAAVAAHPKARHVMHFDERGSAFFALGYARATGRPAAWITTSGTAVANGLPAVVEASVDGVPMLLLTADRPPELRHTGANQTIAQPGLFGDYVRWFFDVPPPNDAHAAAFVLTTVDQAVYRARRAPGGPVHLNCMFREPLAPDPDAPPFAFPEPWHRSGAPFTRYPAAPPPPPADALATLARALDGLERGLVVAGRLGTPADADAARRMAERLGWPLLPDIMSHARLGTDEGGVRVSFFDQVLTAEGFAAAHAPEAVLYLGRPAVSKRLLLLLEQTRPRPFVVVHEGPERLDPRHQVTHRFEAGVAAFCEALATAIAPGVRGAWLEAWRGASARVATAFTGFFAHDDALSEPRTARLVTRHLPAGQGLVLAASMPVRDADAFAVAAGPPVRVAANRGASGIDGTVATAAGFATGLGVPVTLLIGDLALLHDLNSLALLRDRPVTVVAINNDGGGIFHFLPIARNEAVFEPFFGTPHGLTFHAAAALFGLAYARPTTPDAFTEAYRAATGRPGGTIIEVTTDRRENLALHRHLARLARTAQVLSG